MNKAYAEPVPNPVITRFAPSPSGLLHLGHAYSALLNHDLAREGGGSFILRIEDIDQGRCKPEFEEAILQDLRWLGIGWDGQVLRQSDRFDIYGRTVAELAGRGLLYRCFKTRAELSALSQAPHGPQKHRPITAPLPAEEEESLLDEGKSFAWRLNAARAAEAIGKTEITWTEDVGGTLQGRAAPIGELGDPVLGRKDFPASYHLASVIDDAAQDVSLILRGEDLREVVPLHRTLQELLGFDPPVYRHHRLILGKDGKRLAKRDHAATLRSRRESGETPEDIRRLLDLGAPR